MPHLVAATRNLEAARSRSLLTLSGPLNLSLCYGRSCRDAATRAVSDVSLATASLHSIIRHSMAFANRQPCQPSLLAMDQKHLHRATHGATHACTLVALALLVVLTLTRDAHAHGLMTQPRTRGAYRTEKAKPDLPLPVNPTVDYCPHCQNGGGAGMVSMALGGLFSQYMPTKDTKPHAGLCGDRVDGT
eukprot:IDg14002t1